MTSLFIIQVFLCLFLDFIQTISSNNHFTEYSDAKVCSMRYTTAVESWLLDHGLESFHDVLHDHKLNSIDMLRKFRVDTERLVAAIGNDKVTQKIFEYHLSSLGDEKVGIFDMIEQVRLRATIIIADVIIKQNPVLSVTCR